MTAPLRAPPRPRVRAHDRIWRWTARWSTPATAVQRSWRHGKRYRTWAADVSTHCRHRRLWPHMIHEVGGALRHAPATTRGTEPASLAREGHQPLRAATRAAEAREPAGEPPAPEERLEILLDEARQPLAVAQAAPPRSGTSRSGPGRSGTAPTRQGRAAHRRPRAGPWARQGRARAGTRTGPFPAWIKRDDRGGRHCLQRPGRHRFARFADGNSIGCRTRPA